MKILLTTINSKYIHQNLAIRILYELNKHHEGLTVHEFGLKTDTDEIINFCSDFHLLAFSCYIWNINKTIEVAQKIKRQNPTIKILLGGPEVSYDWEEIISLPEIDYIICGEGEIPFASFLKHFPVIDEVPGLVWKKNDNIIINKASETIDLQQLQNINPYQSIPDEELKHKICYIETSRGCPNCCDFCLAGLHNKVRYFPDTTIHTNLSYLMERGKTIKFLDRTFNTHPAFAISIFQFIIEHYRKGNVFQFEIKADILQKELIEYIKQHVPKGIFRFEIGIQTLNAKSNQEIKRKQNFDNIKTFIEQISDKIEIHLDLIVGLPHDYLSDIKYSFEEVFKIFAPELQLGFLKFLKGTPIRKNYQEHAYRFDPSPPYQIIDSKYLSKDDIELIKIVEHTLDNYWNKKRSEYALKYIAERYSIFDFLFGLGKFRQEIIGPKNEGLNEIYTSIYEYSKQQYPDDLILLELIALDYYMQHKVKPGIRFLPEISKEEKNSIIKIHQLNIHQYRHVILPVHFSLQTLLSKGMIASSNELLIIEYTGTDKPQIILQE